MESEHVMCFKIITQDIKFYIVNAYCQFSLDIETILHRIEKILRHIGSENNIIITMDANAKSGWWHSEEHDDRGKRLENFIIGNGLHIINKPGFPPTFMTTNGQSNIDITLTNEKC